MPTAHPTCSSIRTDRPVLSNIDRQTSPLLAGSIVSSGERLMESRWNRDFVFLANRRGQYSCASMPKPTQCERELATNLLCTHWHINAKICRASIKRSLMIGLPTLMLVHACPMSILAQVGFTIARPPMSIAVNTGI